MDSTTMKGTVQGYFDRAFDEMTDKELETRSPTAAWGCERSTLNSEVNYRNVESSALRVSSAEKKEPRILLEFTVLIEIEWRGGRDSNPRPPDRQSGALTNCATTPQKSRRNVSNGVCRDKRQK